MQLVQAVQTKKVTTPSCQFTSEVPLDLSLWTSGETTKLYLVADQKELVVNFTLPALGPQELDQAVWYELTKQGWQKTTTPERKVQTNKEVTKGLTYAEYRSELEAAANSLPHTQFMEAEALPRSSGLKTGKKIGVEKEVITAWNSPGQKLTAKLMVTEPVDVAIRLRYASGEFPVREIRINGKSPFTEAQNIAFETTKGEPPSGGWGNFADDFKTVTLGEPQHPGGYQFRLQPGENSIEMINQDGSGMNLDWIEFLPVGAKEKTP